MSNIVGRNSEQDAALTYLQASPHEIPIVSLAGKAGSGKTLLSIATGIEELKRGNYEKIIVFRSLHALGTQQEMGYLPGDVDDKMAAWSGSVYDAIDVIAKAQGRKKNKNSTPDKVENIVKNLKEMVEVSPITYLRGRSLSNSFLILEEAQNFSRNEILNILSRVGEGTKMVFTFDSAQVDNKFLQSGKNADIWSVVALLKNSPLFAHITLNRTERSAVAELASSILEKI